MPFLNNTKLQEIRSASRGGNEKAAMVLQALRKGANQADLDRLVDDYYGINATDAVENTANVELENPIQSGPDTSDLVEEEKPMGEPIHTTPYKKDEPIQEEPAQEEVVETKVEEQNPPLNDLGQENDFDFEYRLDGDLKDILLENKLDDVDFPKFLKNKANDAIKMQRNADYFKAYDPVKREKYMNEKIQKYGDSFGGQRRNNERKYNDMVKSLSIYQQNVNDMLDDDKELDMSQMNSAYKDFTGDENTMSSFGRHWDEMDNENVKNVLNALVKQYGKKNIIGMLNTLSSDATNYKSFLDNQIDTEVNRYSKDIEKLLK